MSGYLLDTNILSDVIRSPDGRLRHAAYVHALGLTLVTDNTLEFNRIRGLNVENWLER